MSKKFITTWFYSPVDSEEKAAGFFGNKIKKVYDPRSVNFDLFAQTLEETYNSFDDQGYDVVNIIPVAMGTSEQCKQSNGNYVGDVGFSLTRGAVVVGKRRD
ncbi:hypothetical protein AO391_26125 [Pseudomonas marginalis ICMP 9505]|nr:hypothetical protein AO391_26125 [Pseudomonas marginalis ICMP 9505]RMP61103.1 hypothetical protein ALQ18_01048 [Pseudomonas marginalis pv. marginalis]